MTSEQLRVLKVYIAAVAKFKAEEALMRGSLHEVVAMRDAEKDLDVAFGEPSTPVVHG